MRALALMLAAWGALAHVESGVEAYRAGSFAAAVEEFAAAAGRLEDAAPPELHFDLALAALGAGKLDVAETSAELAGVRGGAAWFARRDFLLGCVAYHRATRLEVLAARPESGPPALAAARAAARAAKTHFADAACASGVDWPEALRNAERAARMERRLTESIKRARRGGSTRPKPSSRARSRREGGTGKSVEGPHRPEAMGALTSDQVRSILARLQKLRDERKRLRAARRRAAAASGERGW